MPRGAEEAESCAEALSAGAKAPVFTAMLESLVQDLPHSNQPKGQLDDVSFDHLVLVELMQCVSLRRHGLWSRCKTDVGVFM